MAGGAPWLVAPRLDLADPREANRVLLEELRGGADAVWISLDAAARLALDPRTPAGEQAWGDGGVMAYDLTSWRELFEGVHLDMLTLLLDCGGQPLPCLAPLMALAKERGYDPRKLHWNLGADPAGSLAADGFFCGGQAWQDAQLKETLTWSRKMLPASRAFCLSAEPFHLAGASLSDSLGLLAANLIQLLHQADRIGISPSVVARQVAFRLPMGRDLFLHAAGLRALRLLWRRIFQACGVANPPPAWIHAIGSRRTLSRLDPWSNMLRGSTQAMAAALGGAEAITVCSYDEALGKPSALGRRLARNTPQILSEECGLGDVFDPLGGSYWAEQATARLAASAWEVMQEVEAEGGLISALGHGWVASRLDDSWQERRQAIRRGTTTVLGVNCFTQAKQIPSTAPPRIGPEEERALARWRERADAWNDPEELLEEQAEEDWVAMPFLSRLAACGADVFELVAAARFAIRDGRTLAPVGALDRHRDSEEFEALATRGLRLCGKNPKALLGIVPLAEEKACRANLRFAGECASLAALSREQGSLEQALANPRQVGLYLLCPQDGLTAGITKAARSLQEAGALACAVVGHPQDAAEAKAWQEAGIAIGLLPGDDLIAGLEAIFAQLQPAAQRVAR